MRDLLVEAGAKAAAPLRRYISGRDEITWAMDAAAGTHAAGCVRRLPAAGARRRRSGLDPRRQGGADHRVSRLGRSRAGSRRRGALPRKRRTTRCGSRPSEPSAKSAIRPPARLSSPPSSPTRRIPPGCAWRSPISSSDSAGRFGVTAPPSNACCRKGSGSLRGGRVAKASRTEAGWAAGSPFGLSVGGGGSMRAALPRS